MKLSGKLWMDDNRPLAEEAERLEMKNDQARAIMQRFVDKVDSGRARSTETYAEMKEWLDD